MKIIGATAHYVTEELDAGPIIEQDVVAVTPPRHARPSRGRRRRRALGAGAGGRLALEDRVLRDGETTIVL